jgi:hypothetical protein
MSISVVFEQGNVSPRIVRITTTSTLAQVTAAGWYPNTAPNQLQPSDELEVSYAQGTSNAATALFTVSISAGVVTLTLDQSGIILPVISGHFAVFSGTSGALADLGYLPSDAAKTRVVMAGSAVQIGAIAHFTDVLGTIDDTAGAVFNLGNIYAGADSVAGTLRSYPATTATGYLGLTAVSSAGAFNTTIANASMGQSVVVSIPDPGASTANFVLDTKPAGQSVSSSTASATPGTIRAFKGLMTGSNATMTSGNLVGVRGEVDLVGASGGFVYGVQGKVIPTGTLSGSVWAPAIFGQYDLSAATINAGQIAAIWGDMGASGGVFTDVTGA